MPSTFTFDSQYAFLTYAQLDATVQQLYDALVAVRPIEWARICREQHQDGNPHLHAVIKFERRVKSRRADIFDVLQQHPNIQPVRSVAKSLAYVAKDGEFSDFGPVPSGSNKRSASELFELAATASEKDFWIACAEARLPFQYAAQYRKMQLRGSSTIEEFEPDVSRERSDVFATALPEAKTVVIMGPTGIGKTSWAKRVCPKPALWVRHVDVLRSFNPDYHKSIIFDDMCFKHFPRTAQIGIVDWSDECQVHARYMHATIPAGVTRIFTCNEYPFMADPAIERRVTLLDFY